VRKVCARTRLQPPIFSRAPAPVTPYYQDDAVTIYHGDCREIAPQVAPPGPDVLVIADPPYGAGFDTTKDRGKMYATPRWAPLFGEEEPFDPAWMVAYRAVIFGANHFADRLPSSPTWLVWDKREDHGNNDFADCELAWANTGGPARLFHHYWMGGITKSERTRKLHPTQKPIALMAWVLLWCSRPGDLVLDPYMGSDPILRAAKDAGHRAIGIEIEERYCEIAAKRCAQEVLAL
jgi:site-specific DNA-methyltransferase (adenine-specific)